jgi:hypothetical protein
MRRPYRNFPYLICLRVITAVALGVSFFCSTPAWSKFKWSTANNYVAREKASQKGIVPINWDTLRTIETNPEPLHLAKKKKRFRGSPEDQAEIKRKREEWESLPPERKKELRQKMEHLKRLPPEDRKLFRRRFNQWQRLSPEERRGIRQDLKRLDKLPEQERKEKLEKIRRKFLRD